jgi:hypothetical protein
MSPYLRQQYLLVINTQLGDYIVAISRDIHRPLTYVIFTGQSAEESGAPQDFTRDVDDQARIPVREGNHRSVTPERLPSSPLHSPVSDFHMRHVILGE